MRHVEYQASINAMDPGSVFDTLADYARYAELVDVVHSVQLDHRLDGTTTSNWEVEFRGGFLRWTEENWFHRDRLQMGFRQVEGDFAEFNGSWLIKLDTEGVTAQLNIDFDFGIPSLAQMVEPVAERVLIDVTRQILLGLFGDRVRFPESAVAAKRVDVTI
jgi:ribosome-associated toxin RatA of RatAB toxin-antitoxin module